MEEQETPFTASRADGRSDRRVIYDLAENAEPDTVFTYDELLQALQEGTEREIAFSHIYAAIGAANKSLLTEQKRYLAVVRGVGYRVIHASEQLGVALVKKDRAQNHLKRGIDLLRNARLDELDEAQRTLHEGQLMILAGFHQAIQESERRHNRADQLIKGLLDSNRQIQERLENLEGGHTSDGPS
jgi:uncharacterized protein YlxP (DUF503 family)